MGPSAGFLRAEEGGKDRKYWTARPCTLLLRGGRPGAVAARITQPLGDKFLLRQSCLTTINAAIESIFKPLLVALDIVEGGFGARRPMLRKGTTHDSADGPTETIECNSTLRGSTLPQKVAPRTTNSYTPYTFLRWQNLTPRVLFSLPLVYHVHVYVESIVPFAPSLHSYYVSKNLVISHDLVSTLKLGFGSIRCKYSFTELIRKWSIFRVS